MTRPIKDDAEAVKVAERIIAAQDRLLAAYRSRTLRAPGGAIDTLTAQRPRFEAFLDNRAEMKREGNS